MNRITQILKGKIILMAGALLLCLFGAAPAFAGNVSASITDTGGNVGIGTTSPGYKLSVEGASAPASGFPGYSGTTPSGFIWPNGYAPEVILTRPSTGVIGGVGGQVTYRGGIGLGPGVGMYSVNPNPAGSPYYGDIRFHTTWWDGSNYRNSDRMIIGQGGNVGIGTANPGIYKLAVKGKIHAEEVVVDTGWADFVFKKDYDLMPLEQVAKHIAESGHLPGIPTEQEVKENGVSLGQVQSTLLQKIEEMTLYVIDLKKDSDLLKKENETLKERISSLENRPM